MKNLEDKLQEACVTWFKYQYPDITIFAIPNGGSRNPIEAAKLKRTGTLAGVADLFIMKCKYIPEYRLDGMKMVIAKETYYNSLFIELKIGKNKQSDPQKEFEANAIKAGYDYHVVRSIDEFINVVNEYLS